jgi:hypothetical protein
MRELTRPLTPALSPQAGRGRRLADPAVADDLVKNLKNRKAID